MTKTNNSGKKKEWSKISRNSSIKLLKKTVWKSKNFIKKSGNSGLNLNSITSIKLCPAPQKTISTPPPKPKPNLKNTNNNLTPKTWKSDHFKTSMISSWLPKPLHKTKKLQPKMLSTAKNSNKNSKNSPSKGKTKRRNSKKSNNSSKSKSPNWTKSSMKKLKRSNNWTALSKTSRKTSLTKRTPFHNQRQRRTWRHLFRTCQKERTRTTQSWSSTCSQRWSRSSNWKTTTETSRSSLTEPKTLPQRQPTDSADDPSHNYSSFIFIPFL